MPKNDTCVPKPAAEVTKKILEIAEDAALSRLLPIQDGPDKWQEQE
jgi:hypothetical protein